MKHPTSATPTSEAARNPFTLLEYDPIKLLNKPQKVASMFEVRDGTRDYDPLFPLSVELHLTDVCNLRCGWCTDLELRRNLASLPLATIESLFAEFAQHHVGVTIEGGGEPTVYKHFAEVVALAARHKLDIGLITNGIRPLASLANQFKWIRISMDASCAEEYVAEKGVQRYDKVRANIATLGALPDKRFLLGVGYVMTRRNTGRLLEFIEEMDAAGVDYIYLRPVEEMPDLSPDLAMLYELKSLWETTRASTRRIKVLMNLDDRIQKDNEGLPCIAHALSCVIQADGNVAMCEKRRHDPVVFGNINAQRFTDIWRGALRKDVSRRLLDPCAQRGCEVCRITKFNRYFVRLGELYTRNFI
jgi:radical SAM protein with 4Fe4S-binding SPASM domain